MNAQTRLINIATRQGGVVRREQAMNLGLTRNQIDYCVSSRRWSPLTAGGYRLIEMPGRLSMVRAAHALLPRATVSHHSAAALLKLGSVQRNIVSVSVATGTTHTFPGVVVHRNSDLAIDHVTMIRGLRTTSIARTIMDLAGVSSPRRTEWVIDDALADGRCTVAELSDVLESVARRGKPGVSVMRSILSERSPGDDRQSRLERKANALLVKAGLEGYELERSIPWDERRRFDVAFAAHSVAIEWDGRRWHTMKAAFRADRERDRLAMEHGWLVLRFTWHDVVDDPASVVATIRTVLSQRAQT